MGLKVVRFIVALIMLFIILYLGRFVSLLIPIGIPDSIWGLLILFGLLVANVIKVEWVMPATKPLLRYMTLFFLPICAGIVEQSEVLMLHLSPLLISNLLSSLLSLVVIGYLAQWLFKQEENDDEC